MRAKSYTLIVQIMMTTNYDDGLIDWSFFRRGGPSEGKKSRKNIQIIVTVLKFCLVPQNELS